MFDTCLICDIGSQLEYISEMNSERKFVISDTKFTNFEQIIKANGWCDNNKEHPNLSYRSHIFNGMENIHFYATILFDYNCFN